MSQFASAELISQTGEQIFSVETLLNIATDFPPETIYTQYQWFAYLTIDSLSASAWERLGVVPIYRVGQVIFLCNGIPLAKEYVNFLAYRSDYQFGYYGADADLLPRPAMTNWLPDYPVDSYYSTQIANEFCFLPAPEVESYSISFFAIVETEDDTYGVF